MKIYLDVCCLNRPFDDLSQERIQFESDAVLAILARCYSETWTLVSSEAIELELNRIQSADKKKKIFDILSISKERLPVSEQALLRSVDLRENGIKPMDSLHLSVAEDFNIDILLTTDDSFLKTAKKMKLGIKVANPATWFMEVIQDEH